VVENSVLGEILADMELEISNAQMIDNTPMEARAVRIELCEAMRELIRRAYYTGFGVSITIPDQPKP
jgi:hypothetical protein